jgi:hypothetical protein
MHKLNAFRDRLSVLSWHRRPHRNMSISLTHRDAFPSIETSSDPDPIFDFRAHDPVPFLFKAST